MTKREEIIGRGLFEIFPDNPNDAAADGVSNLIASLNFVLKNKIAHTMAVQKYDIRKPDNTFEERFWSPINKPVLDKENQVAFIIHRVEDVTEFVLMPKEQHKKDTISQGLQRRLEASEIEILKRMKEIQKLNIKLEKSLHTKTIEATDYKKALAESFERITDAFVALDKNWGYTYMNKRAGEIFNCNPEKIIGKHIWTEFPEGIDQSFYKAYYKAMEEQRYIHVEEYYSPYDKWFENHIYPSPEGLSIFFRDVTEKKKAEDALNQHRIFIESIINASPDIIYIYDIEERKNVYVNEGMQMILSYTDDEIKQMDNMVLPILMHPDDFNYYLHNTYPKYATTQDKEIISHEFRMKNKDGNWHWLYSKESIFLRNPNGTPKQIFGITTDITEQKKSEDEIAKVNERFRLLAKATNDVVWDWDLATNKLWWNDNYYSHFGFPKWSISSDISTWYDGLHPEDKERVIEGIHEAIEKGQQYWSDEYRFLKMDGTTVFIFDRGYILYDKENKPYRMVGAMLDTTERKKAEQEINEHATQLQTLSDNLPDSMMYQGIRELEGKMKFTYVSKTVVQLTGKTQEEVIQNPALLYNTIHEADRQKMAEGEKLSLLNMSVFNMVIRSHTLSGEIRWVHIRSVPRKLADGSVTWDGICTDITESKNASQVVKESEEKYHLIFENMINAFAQCEIILNESNSPVDFRFITVNPAFERIIGSKAIDIIGKTAKGILPDVDLYWVESAGKVALKGGTINIEQRSKALNKTFSVTMHSAKRMEFIVVIEDITERKNAEDVVKESEEKFRTLVEQASDAIFLFNYNGDFLDVNTSAVKLSGYSREELLERTIYHLSVEDDIKMNPFQHKELETGKILINERKYKRKDGTIVDVEVSTKLLTDGRFQGIARNITERKKTEKEIRKVKERFEIIAKATNDAVWEWDIVTGESWHNEAFLQLFEIGPEGIRVKPTTKLWDLKIHPDDRERVLSSLNLALRGTSSMWANEFRFLLPDGSYGFFYDRGFIIRDESGKALRMLGSMMNITERKKAEEEIKISNEQLRLLTTHLQNIREEERKRIGREIHDDLGQQLTAIKMDVAWIDKKTPEESAIIKSKLKNIIGLLDGSNVSVRKILNELRTDILDNYGLMDALEWQGRQFTANTDIPLSFSCYETVLKVEESIATCIFRAFQEALTNITKYADAHKVITSLTCIGNYFILTIEDDGKGFDTTQLKSRQSFGILGMKERVASLNGKFELISSPGRGTKIIITIPDGLNKIDKT